MFKDNCTNLTFCGLYNIFASRPFSIEILKLRTHITFTKTKLKPDRIHQLVIIWAQTSKPVRLVLPFITILFYTLKTDIAHKINETYKQAPQTWTSTFFFLCVGVGVWGEFLQISLFRKKDFSILTWMHLHVYSCWLY